MKARHVLWPVVILGALSLVGACSDDAGVAVGVGGEAAGGGDGTGAAGKGSGGSSSGGSKQAGGMTSEGGSTTVGGGDGETAGAGGAGGAGIDLCVGLTLTCEDDDNPCTEEECNPATGECGIPRTGTSCNDEVFCNGADTCDAGVCSDHAGDPCGGQTCNETEGACECTLDEHCPADVPGAWGECAYGSTCVETGSRSRPVTTFTCTGGMCVQGATVAAEACTRDTDTAVCADDANRCNGAEQCKVGNCVGVGNPCSGATPYCYGGGTMCRECSGNDGCGGGEKCCQGGCIPTANTCLIIIPTSIINPTISPSIGTFSPG